jgi:hypothetical protein
MRRFAEQLIALILQQADDEVSVESHGGDHDPEQTKAASFNAWAHQIGLVAPSMLSSRFPPHMSDTTLPAQSAAAYRRTQPELTAWASGYGAIQYALRCVFATLSAADRLATAAMWLVVPMTYARTVHPSGRPLHASHFKAMPEGHTGGSLNMVPAYVGYLLANVPTGTTRSVAAYIR